MTDPKHIHVEAPHYGESFRSTSLADKADIEIWSMFKEGHEGAFNFIYKNYFHLLFKYGIALPKTAKL